MSRRLPLVFGTALVGAFFATGHALYWAPNPYAVLGTSRFLWTSLFLGLVLVASYATGLPELPESRQTALGASLGAVVLGLIGVSLVQLALGAPLLPRSVIAGIGITFLPWSLFCWNIEADRARRNSTKAVFVGDPQEFAELQADLVDQRVSVQLVGRLEFTESFRADIRNREIGMIILDIASLADPRILTEVSSLHREGVRVRTVSLFAEEFLGKIPLADLERVSLLFDVGEVHRITYVRWKRLIDVAVGCAAATVLASLTLVVLVGNVLGNRGPLLYRQPRVGKDGHVFQIVKFRTMQASETGDTDWTTDGDPRITPFGSMLRRSHLDELPQVWNILRGDLSIVGPRPEQPHYVEALNEKIPFFDVRHLIRPGLTGWAQVMYRYGSDEADAREKLQYDLYYLRRQTPRLDVQILIRTLRTVVGRTGR